MKKPSVPKKYQQLYNETARQKVLGVLFQFPEKEFSLSDLAKEAGVAKANIGKILEELHSNNFIGITKLNVTWRIRANQRDPNFIKNKIIFNLNMIYQINLVEFLNEYFKNPKLIILFGTFRWGMDISTSDIDIAIEDETIKDHEIVSLRELIELENMIGRKIQIHLFNKGGIDNNLYNNIINGIILSGFLETSRI